MGCFGRPLIVPHEHFLLELLEGEEHDDVPRPEACKVGPETRVKSEEAVVGERLHKAVDRALVRTRRRTHHAALDDVHGAPDAHSKEPSAKARGEVAVNVVLEPGMLDEALLDLVVARQLHGIDGGVAHHIGAQASPHLGQPFLLQDDTVRAQCGRVFGRHPGRELPLRLHAHLDQVRRTRDSNSEGSGEKAREYLGRQRRVTLEVLAQHGVTHRLIQADPQPAVQALAVQTWLEPLPQGAYALLLRHRAERANKPTVLGRPG